MALRFKDLTSQIDGVNQIFTISPATYDAGSPVLIYNGEPVTPLDDFTEDPARQILNTVFIPQPNDKLIVYYSDPSIGALPTDFTIETLKSDYLFGFDLKNQFGCIITDVTLGNKLAIAVAKMERELKDFNLTPKVIKSSGVQGIMGDGGVWVQPPEPALEAAADIIEDPYDYDVGDYLNWGYMALRRKPIVSVERIRLIYPTGQTIIAYPKEWIKIYHKFAQIQIVPMAGSFKQYPLIGQGAMYLPLLSGFLTKNVPSLIHVDYTAGLTTIPDDLKDAIYKMGAIESLKLAGGGKMPGVASLSTAADGLSESTTLTQSQNTQLYGALIKQYQEDVDKFTKDYRVFQKGLDFKVM